MDTTLPQKFPFILDRNLAKANCTEDRVCTSCDKVVLGADIFPYDDSEIVSVCPYPENSSHTVVIIIDTSIEGFSRVGTSYSRETQKLNFIFKKGRN